MIGWIIGIVVVIIVLLIILKMTNKKETYVGSLESNESRIKQALIKCCWHKT